MNAILETAVSAARSAGKIIQDGAKDLGALNIEQKSLHDYVSEIDRESERIIVESIHQRFPDHRCLGEEYGEQIAAGKTSGSVDIQWIIDPLDGTTNFLRSIPHYAVSIGVLDAGVLQHAVVYDPAKDELFSASRGEGASLNGKTINVADADSIKGALLSTGVPYSGENLQELDCFTNTMSGLLDLQTSGVRRLGAAALDLAYVAAGRYDGFWEAKLQPWDIAAGALLVTEAAGVVSDLHGGQDYLQSGDVLAASPAVHAAMLGVTERCYSEKTL